MSRMSTVKKVLGYVLITVAVFLALAGITVFFVNLKETVRNFERGDSYGSGYVFGSFAFLLFITFVVIFLMKKGLKLIRQNAQLYKALDEIGK